MNAERWRRITETFDSALEHSPDARHSYLAEACGNDEDLRGEVARLLAEFEKAGDFLEKPLIGPSQMLATGELVATRYRIEALIGRGGMGEVYRAHDELLGEPVALKTLRGEYTGNPSVLRRFQREVQLARKVTHPNVCRVFDVGTHGTPARPLHFFTMELLDGETLAARIRRAGPMTRDEAFPLILQMADGLQAAHQAGIVHRDFKSSNIMLCCGKAIITDFGLARFEALAGETEIPGSITTNTQIAGTVAYMSPEQLSGGEVTAASDIYSFGVVLFEMATARLPFDGNQIIKSAMQRASEMAPNIRALAPKLEPQWATAITRCLQRDPTKRYPAAHYLARHFQSGWRPPTAYWTRREWAVTLTGLAASTAAGTAVWHGSHPSFSPPRPEAQSWYDRGVDGLHSLTYDAARRSLVKSTELDPEFAIAHAELARAYALLDYWNLSRSSLATALHLEGRLRLSTRDQVRLGAIRQLLNWELDAAAGSFARLRSISSGYAAAAVLVELGWIADRKKDVDTARRMYEDALHKDPSLAAAKLRLGALEERTGRVDVAINYFVEAEALFAAASNLDGVTEALYERAMALGRANRRGEALSVVSDALRKAETAGDDYQSIRLQMALAMITLREGNILESQRIAEGIVKLAKTKNMDNTAASGMLDLGNTYLFRSETSVAEDWFLQGLEAARRHGGLQIEARALLSLASVNVMTDHPEKVISYVDQAMLYFSRANFHQEVVQGWILKGGAYQDLTQFDEAEHWLRRAVREADQLDDTEQAAVSRSYLASVLEDKTAYPEALEVQLIAVQKAGTSRGGARRASLLVNAARLHWNLGDYHQATMCLDEAESSAEKDQLNSSLLRSRVLLCRAQLHGDRREWKQAGLLARAAVAISPHAEISREARFLVGLSEIVSGQLSSGLERCKREVEPEESKVNLLQRAGFMLFLAETIPDVSHAQQLSQTALLTFAPMQISEKVWRCCTVLAPLSEAKQSMARSAVHQLVNSWSKEAFRSYCGRPSIQNRIRPWL